MGSNPVSSSRFKTAKPTPRTFGTDQTYGWAVKPVLVTCPRENGDAAASAFKAPLGVTRS